MKKVNLKDKYDFLELLGRGSNSTVYLVKHKALSKLLVFKEASSDEGVWFQHRNEVQILKNVSFPGMPELYEYEETKDYFYIVEEYISGRSLQSILMQSISQEQFINYGLQIAKLFFCLHENEAGSILYLDIKPEHFIVRDNRVYLIDYGLATITTKPVVENLFYGTERYSAPEIKEYHEATVASDIYGLGILFLEMYKKTFFFNKKLEVKISELIGEMIDENPKRRCESLQRVIQIITDAENLLENSLTVNLSKKIVVVGSQSRVGTTYVATTITSCLNRLHYPACYHESSKERWILNCTLNKAKAPKEGLRWRGSFKAEPHFGPFVSYIPDDQSKKSNKNNTIEIYDGGIVDFGNSYEEYDLIILVLGARLWEQKHSYEVSKQAFERWKCKVFCTLQTKREVRELAQEIEKEIIYLPPKENPYKPDKKISKEVLQAIQELIK